MKGHPNNAPPSIRPHLLILPQTLLGGTKHSNFRVMGAIFLQTIISHEMFNNNLDDFYWTCFNYFSRRSWRLLVPVVSYCVFFMYIILGFIKSFVSRKVQIWTILSFYLILVKIIVTYTFIQRIKGCVCFTRNLLVSQ